MKAYYIYIVMFLTISASCSGFLDEIDQDKFVPSDADHYSAMLLENFTADTRSYYNVQYMTDEVHQCTTREWLQVIGVSLEKLYTWQKYIDLGYSGEDLRNNSAWRDYYNKIAICNYVLEEIDNATGSAEDKNRVKGEAFFIRAYCYFCLVNLYAEPYESEQQAKATYGIPSRTDIGIETIYYRSMLDENYRVIVSDINNAIELIEAGSPAPSIYHPNLEACKILASRIALHMKDYTKVIDYTTDVIEKSRLYKLTQSSGSRTFINRNNPEVLYSFGLVNSCISSREFNYVGFEVNPDFLDSYDMYDLRPSVFFAKEYDQFINKNKNVIKKNSIEFSELGFVNIRSAEAWLNRAEAYAFSKQPDKAIEDLTYLLSYRLSNIDYLTLPTDDDELIDFIFQERFREFCFEEQHRWFDLRRMGPERRPEITHNLITVDAQYVILKEELFILRKEDRNYTLNVPVEEKNRNPLLMDFDRIDKLPVSTN